jgi:predicted amidophosphoribosyltransferase
VKKTAEMKGKTIVLFDDVITTGSTVKEACRTLKMAGATHVFALSLLRD